MLVHVARDRAGRRRVSEIAVLHASQGQVRPVTVWHVDRGPTEEIVELRLLLQARGAT
ncbi:hypothetical protein [Mycobacterium kyorinense]|uniref:hypothetical protein n=1 Tax=Mycobacterium kyorinense TaxID=487514 RepID=UPI0013020A19|nr:hypothetical protein [Mycobacterium kyorinense]